MLYNIVTLESEDPAKLPHMIEEVLKRLGETGQSTTSGKSPGHYQARGSG